MLIRLSFLTPKLRQVLVSISMGLIMTGMMGTFCYPAIALPQMSQLDSPIKFTKEESSWFASVTLLMSIPSSVIGASVCEWMGPRKLFMILTPLLCISTMAMAIASWELVYQAGAAESFLLTFRVLQGVFLSILYPGAFVYVYEICDQEIRGTMTGFLDVWSTLGYLLCYITGCFLTWNTVAWLLPLITFVPGTLGLLFSPESPLWLVRKGRDEAAKAVLIKYRSSTLEVEENLRLTRDDFKKRYNNTSEFLKVLVKKPNLSPMIASSIIVIMRELVGPSGIWIYMVHIFEQAGVGLEAKFSSVVVGSVRLICNIIAILLLHNFRRKLLLISGNTLAGVASCTVGVFFYLQSTGHDVSGLPWLPLVGLATHMFGFSAAIGPISWTLAVEVLPEIVRNLGFGMALTSFSIVAFAISKCFIFLQSAIGMYGIFWMCTCSALLYNIILIFFLPETQGLSLQDIESYWSKTGKKGKIDPEKVPT